MPDHLQEESNQQIQNALLCFLYWNRHSLQLNSCKHVKKLPYPLRGAGKSAIM